MPQDPLRSAGWTRGVSRLSSLYVLAEFKNATKELAANLNISSGVLTERALLAFMEALPNGKGKRALETVAEVRQHAEGARRTRCTSPTSLGTRCSNDALPDTDRCGHHPRDPD